LTASSIHYYLAFFVIFPTQFFSQPTAVVSDKVTRGHLKILPQFGTGASKRALQFVQRKFLFSLLSAICAIHCVHNCALLVPSQQRLSVLPY